MSDVERSKAMMITFSNLCDSRMPLVRMSDTSELQHNPSVLDPSISVSADDFCVANDSRDIYVIRVTQSGAKKSVKSVIRVLDTDCKQSGHSLGWEREIYSKADDTII
jgi:hypothetical protein